MHFTCDACDGDTFNAENEYGEHVCDDCLQNAAELAWERHCNSEYTSLQQQQIEARRLK